MGHYLSEIEDRDDVPVKLTTEQRIEALEAENAALKAKLNEVIEKFGRHTHGERKDDGCGCCSSINYLDYHKDVDVDPLK